MKMDSSSSKPTTAFMHTQVCFEWSHLTIHWANEGSHLIMHQTIGLTGTIGP